MSLRRLALLNAATLVAELGDLYRFATTRQLMGHLGLVPSEDSTGDDRQQRREVPGQDVVIWKEAPNRKEQIKLGTYV